MKMTDAQKESKVQNDEIVFSYDNDSHSNINNFNNSVDCVNNSNNTQIDTNNSKINNDKKHFSIHFNKYECKNVFIFLILPIRTDIKPQIIHLKPSKSGAANIEIERIISIILEHLKKSCFTVRL